MGADEAHTHLPLVPHGNARMGQFAVERGDRSTIYVNDNAGSISPLA